jgi:hypothetical protein
MLLELLDYLCMIHLCQLAYQLYGETESSTLLDFRTPPIKLGNNNLIIYFNFQPLVVSKVHKIKKRLNYIYIKKSKVIPITGRGGLQNC